MCCNPCILICGSRQFQQTPESTVGYENAPDKIICPRCAARTSAMYKVTETYWSICFIPCCHTGSSTPYLVCSNCSFKLGSNEYKKCQCGLYNPKNYSYCPDCGRSN